MIYNLTTAAAIVWNVWFNHLHEVELERSITICHLTNAVNELRGDGRTIMGQERAMSSL